MVLESDSSEQASIACADPRSSSIKILPPTNPHPSRGSPELPMISPSNFFRAAIIFYSFSNLCGFASGAARSPVVVVPGMIFADVVTECFEVSSGALSWHTRMSLQGLSAVPPPPLFPPPPVMKQLATSVCKSHPKKVACRLSGISSGREDHPCQPTPLVVVLSGGA